MTAATPPRLRVLAPAKINLCLFLGPVRQDGRHELVTLFESVELCDELVIATAADGADRVECARVEGPNLVADALARLRDRGWAAPPLHVEITKRIPVAGGMGGGSADAAALLRVAPQLGSVADAELAAIAASIGADVPAQLAPGLAIGTGAGEEVRRVPPLASHGLAIVPLAARLSTAAVYAEADRQRLARAREDLAARLAQLDQALSAGGRLPGSLLVNDLQPAASALCPSIDDALQAVADAGADDALLCGSGPTVAGVFWGPDGLARAVKATERLSGRFPGACGVTAVSSRPSGKIAGS